MMKKLRFTLLAILAVFATANAQTTLGIGQIAVIGVNTDQEDFTFVLLDNIDAGTKIYFTDEEPSSPTSIGSGEGVVEYTAPSNIPCGTVISYQNSIINFRNVGGNFGSFALANGGDGVIAFQGVDSITGAVDSFLHAMNCATTYSILPLGLNPGNYIELSQENGEYTGPKVDTDANLFAAINNAPANHFENNNFSAYNLTDTNFTVTNCVLPSSTPTTQASSIQQISCVGQQNNITIQWTPGDGLNRIVVISTAAISGTPSNNTTYTADAQYNNGQSTLNAGEYVVYNGNGNQVTVTGLAAGTLYNVQVFEYNGSPGSENYLTSSATNNPQIFITATRPNTIPVAQSFDASGTSWTYCTTPASTYNSGGDVFSVVSSLGPISGPALGTDLFGMRDLDNPINGLTSSGDDHILEFQTIDVSAYPAKQLKFKYWIDMSFAGSSDRMYYNVQYDTGTMWPTADEVELHTPGIGAISTGGWDSIVVNVPASANFVRLRLGGSINGGSDYYAFDDVRLEVYTGPPIVSSVNLINPTTIQVDYNMPVNATGANTANYTGLPVGVSSVVLNGSSTSATVNLSGPLPPGSHQLIINNVQNAGGTPMAGSDTGLVEIIPNILITEIMYNPSGSDALEFIEIFNAELVPVNLAGYSFTEGISYTFPSTAASIIPPGGYQIIASSFATFNNAFGSLPDHQFSGGLGNGGEDIELSSALGSQVAYVDYRPDGLWPATADGNSPSLVYCSAAYALGNNNDPANWGVSQTYVTDSYDGSNFVFASPRAAECTNAWLGRIDSTWSNPANWSLNMVPMICANDVVIGSDFLLDNNIYQYPTILADSTENCANFTILPGARITIGVNPGDTGILNICGDFVNYGQADMGWGAVNFLGPASYSASGPMTVGALNCGVPTGQQVDLNADFVGNLRYGIGFGPNSGDLVVDPAASVTLLSDSSGNTAWVDDFTFSPTTGDIVGDITIQRYVNNPGNAFHYLGSMVNSATASEWADDFSIASTGASGGHLSHVIPLSNCSQTAIASNSPYGGLFDYIESVVSNCNLEGWRVIADPAYGLVPGVGYAGIIPDGAVVDIIGNPNTAKLSPITTPITFTPSNNGGSQGYNLVANPFPSGLNWAVAGQAANNPDIDGSAWVWESTGYYSGTLKEVNVMLPGIIASGQAFEVMADGSNGTMNFTNAMRSQTAGAFVRQAPLYQNRINLIVEGNNHADQTNILFADIATNNYDRGFDTYNKTNPDGYPTLSSKLNSDNLGIQSLPTFTGMESIDIDFSPGANGQFTIKAEELGTLPANTLTFLEDKQTGTTSCLTFQPSYTFTSNVNDAEGRFRLFFNPPVEPSSTKASCAGNDASMSFNLGSVTWDAWELKDDQGNVVSSGTQASGAVQLNGLAGGVYNLVMDYQGNQINTAVTVDAAVAVDAMITTSTQIAEVGELIQINAQVSGANWFELDLGDGTLLTANAFDYAYSEPGIYELKLNANNDDCAALDLETITVVSKTTSVEDLDTESFTVEATGNSLNLRFFEQGEVVQLTVFDMSGKQVFAKEGIKADSRFSLDLSSGYYIAEAVSAENRVVKKFLMD